MWRVRRLLMPCLPPAEVPAAATSTVSSTRRHARVFLHECMHEHVVDSHGACRPEHRSIRPNSSLTLGVQGTSRVAYLWYSPALSSSSRSISSTGTAPYCSRSGRCTSSINTASRWPAGGPRLHKHTHTHTHTHTDSEKMHAVRTDRVQAAGLCAAPCHMQGKNRVHLWPRLTRFDSSSCWAVALLVKAQQFSTADSSLPPSCPLRASMRSCIAHHQQERLGSCLPNSVIAYVHT